jgi:N,N'-diacetyllegionaminate synthase
MNSKVLIGTKQVGLGCPTYVIAEAGVNHNGSIDLAKQIIKKAKSSGADCVKFQTFKAERVVTQYAPKAAYQLRVTDPSESQLIMLKKFELTEADYRVLINECCKENIDFLSTPYSIEDAEMLNELGVPAFKIASGQLVELPLLADIAKFNKPIILSTGMATLNEIKEAVATLIDNNNSKIVLLQCTTNYPSSVNDANLRSMKQIADETRSLVGYSDHTKGIIACLTSVALGAVLVEKHFTLDNTMDGPDHLCSSEPQEFRELVTAIREVESALGDGLKRPTDAELCNIIGMRRSIVAARLIEPGTSVTAYDFAFKRPASGLAPKCLGELLGKKSVVRIEADEQVSLEMFA